MRRLLDEVAIDQALLLQLTPEAMDLFNATTSMRPGVRYGSVVTCARPPGLRSALAAGLDPSAHATMAIYNALYRLAAQTPRARERHFTAREARALRRAYRDRLPSLKANDGVVPAHSQVWGKIIHAARADHLDVIGHFRDPSHGPPHFDWLTTGSGFTREHFERVWTDVMDFACSRSR